MRTVSRNNPIATVIKNYTNKKSGKVTEARNEIQRRFFGLDWKDQKKIVAAFLDSGVSDRDWAYSRLLDLWDASFEQKMLYRQKNVIESISTYSMKAGIITSSAVGWQRIATL